MPIIALAVILGLIQGLCEFLPISSSGHLVLAQAFFGLREPEVAFDLVLHLGTLLAVTIFYREPLTRLCRELKYLPGALANPVRLRELYQNRPDFRFGILVIAGCGPTALIGLFLQDLFMVFFHSALAVGLALLATGFLLKLSCLKSGQGRDMTQMTLKDALIIGAFQGLAIAPGFSRSGFTICAGLFLNLEKELAARYSFIMSIPAILGAAILEAVGATSQVFTGGAFVAGFLVAGFSGYLALRLLVFVIRKNSFPLFAYWCWAMGLTAVGWHILVGA